MNTTCHLRLRRSESIVAGGVAAVASAITIGTVLALVQAATATPWVRPEHAALIARCDAERAPSRRHACLRQLAADRAVMRVAAS
jgi:hypothetical protein